MDKLFGTKKKEEKKPEKKLHELSDEELKETQRNFKKKLMQEQREIDRMIMNMEMMRKKAEAELTKECKKEKGDKFVKQTYARQVQQAIKHKDKYTENKYKIKNLEYGLDTYFANVKLAKVMSISSDVMKQINSLINVKEMNKTMMEMQGEMMKLGMVNEMIDDTLSNMNDDVEIDNQQEVDDIISNIEKQYKKVEEKPNVNVQQGSAAVNFDDMDERIKNLLN